MEQAVNNPLAGKTIVVAAWIIAFLLIERLIPAVTRVGGWRRVLRNAGLWLVNVGLGPLVVIPISAWAASSAPFARPDWLAGWGGLIFDLIFLDFLIYWWHRANHVVPTLWRFHEIHHLDQFLDVTSALRFHFGEVLLSALFRAGVIFLFAIPLTSVVVFEAVVLLSAIFHHSNVRLPRGFEAALSKLIITPSIHWVHHHAVRADTDSNYGTLFSFWDRLFKSRSPAARTGDMPIGVEAEEDRDLPNLLIRPFRLRR